MIDQVDPETDATAGVPWWRRRRDAEAFAKAERWLRRPMTVLALVFTFALALEFSQDLAGWASYTLLAVNVGIWLAFAAEYLWRLRLAPDRARFVRTHVLDLMVVVLPTLRPLRAIRVLRLLAVATRSWRQVFSVLRHRGLGKVISSVVALMIVGGLITFALEPQTFTNVGDAVWWVLVTSTTVGYGDFAPVSTGARLVAVVIMILGIGLVGIITANIVDFMSGEGHGATDPGGAAASCPACQETAERLTRMEAQLGLLLAQRTGSGEAP
ncbi:MAG: potassium channel family protein [Nitriliruptoraceae bacterium]